MLGFHRAKSVWGAIYNEHHILAVLVSSNGQEITVSRTIYASRDNKKELAILSNTLKSAPFWTPIQIPDERKNVYLCPILDAGIKSRELRKAVQTQVENAVHYKDPFISFCSVNVPYAPSPASPEKKSYTLGVAARNEAIKAETTFWQNIGLKHFSLSIRPLALVNLFLALRPDSNIQQVILTGFDEFGSEFCHLCNDRLLFHRWSMFSPFHEHELFLEELHLTRMHIIEEASNRCPMRTADSCACNPQTYILPSETIEGRIGQETLIWNPFENPLLLFPNRGDRDLCKEHLCDSVMAIGIALQGL